MPKSRSPITVAVGAVVLAFAGVAAFGGLSHADVTSTDTGPLTCPGNRVTGHHIDYDGVTVTGAPLDPLSALTGYLTKRHLDLASKFVPLETGPDDVVYSATDSSGGTVALLRVVRIGTSWRMDMFEACVSVVTEGAIR